GPNTMTGGRVKRVLPYIKDENFLLTYGDGVTDSDINATIKYHKKQKRILTMTAVQPPGRFGDLEIADGKVVAFREKPERQAAFINGGYFVVNRSIGKYLGDDTCVFEQEPMAGLAADEELGAYEHRGFWQCMDTFREQQLLTNLWNSGKAPWKVW
ncbi:MAG: sugar phosphate nucleotidyltransferase, partial [Verrucomicrobiota bacterium]